MPIKRLTFLAFSALGFFTFSLLSFNLSAQYNENSKLLNVGSGVVISGNLHHPNNFDSFDSNNWIPVHFSYEMGLSENTFAEDYAKNITLGVFGIYHRQAHTFYSTLYNYELYRSWNTFNLGALANFHYTEFIPKSIASLDQEKWDLYGGLKVGIFLEYYQTNFNLDPTDLTALTGGYFDDDIRYMPNLSLSFGARYHIVKPISVYAELGIGSYNLFNFGLTYTK
jgi:hypothetical protein